MLLTTKTLDEEKQKRFIAQNGKCLICKLDLNPDYKKNHLDHDHSLDGKNAGKCRGLLCIYCNPTEGIIKQKFERSGLKSKVEYIVWLESLLEYLKKDLSQENIHPKFISDISKRFSRLSLSEQREEFIKMGFPFEMSDKKSDLVKKYKKLYRNLIK